MLVRDDTDTEWVNASEWATPQQLFLLHALKDKGLLKRAHLNLEDEMGMPTFICDCTDGVSRVVCSNSVLEVAGVNHF
jgi:hypothetical protein